MSAITYSLRLIDTTTGAAVTGQRENLALRVSPYAGGDVIGGLTVSEIGSQGNYKFTGFGAYYQDVKVFLNGSELTSFGIFDVGDPDDNYLSTSKTTAQTLAGQLVASGTGLKTDIIVEKTGAAGVSVDGLTIKDSAIRGTNPAFADVIAEYGSGNGVTVDGVLLKDDIYTGHTGRAFLTDANNILVDNKRAADLAGYVYNDLDTALTYAAGVASVNSRINIFLKMHIGSYYTLSSAIPDYVNFFGIGGMVIIRGVYTRSGSAALSSRMENIYFEAYDGNHVIVRTIAKNTVWQTLVDSGSGGTISLTSSHINNCGLYGTYTDVGDDVTSGGTNKINNSFGNFNVSWQSSDNIYSFDYYAGDTFSY